MTRTKLSEVQSFKTPSPHLTKAAYNLNDLMDRHFNIFDELFNEATSYSSKLNLPYNTILIDDNTYRIELALAGYAKDDISVYIENGSLYIETFTDKNSDQPEESVETTTVEARLKSNLNVSSYPHYVHKGISNKYLKIRFGVPKNYKTFTAKFENGILSIDIKTENSSKIKHLIDIK